MAAQSVQQTAQQLGLSIGTIWRHIKSGAIPATKIGNRWRILQSDIDGLFQKTKTES